MASTVRDAYAAVHRVIETHARPALVHVLENHAKPALAKVGVPADAVGPHHVLIGGGVLW